MADRKSWPGGCGLWPMQAEGGEVNKPYRAPRAVGCFGFVFCVFVAIWGYLSWGMPVTATDWVGVGLVGMVMLGCLVMFLLGEK